ncbi:hypothetical protein ABW20_dc0105039 [Dactylellina cionopaga]|nr:hypothetical protein ABW20_dc0105039 [Dactylellina cionopaga]
MPSKSAPKPAKAAAPKSPKPTKSKAHKSSEYVDDSDLGSDESMDDAPPSKKATPKSSDKTAKKRNRDGTEKVDGVKMAPSKTDAKGKASEPKAANGAGKKGKSVQVVEVSNEEESEATSPEESSEEDSGESDSDSESGTSEPTNASSVSKNAAAFKLPLDKSVPAGFTPLSSTSSESISSSLQGKQIFLFTAPSKFKFSDIKKIKLFSGIEGEKLESGGINFMIRRPADSVSSSMKVILPREGKKGYQLATTTPTIQYTITEAPPSGRSNKVVEKALPPQPREQPEGLRMRFMPAGYGEETDININEAVLPRRDLVIAAEDEDVVMDDTEVVAPMPKKSKKDEDIAVETPKKEKKKKVKAPEGGVLAPNDEENPESIESGKKSKKDKKDKSVSTDERKKEKKSKHRDENEKKEKKKHKKEKAEA